MQPGFQTLTERIGQLDRAVADLEQAASAVGLAPPGDQPWFDLLHRKLVPQLELAQRMPHLVVALVGGTNIGKSLLFNHLAGEVASGVSPLAAGTKHPVCLVPPRLADQPTLAKLFEGFELAPWQHADDPLRDYQQNVLFWRIGSRLPEWLLLLDTPDVDSDVQVNWQRAGAIRQVADVLIAVLTQQKYNDAAVKQFFREAAAADKPVIVLFNQTDLERDRQYWPLWLETFVGQSGAKPLDVYVAPHDRRAAEQLELPIFCVGGDARQWNGRPVDWSEHLGRLHYDTIKVRALRGALMRILDPEHGLPGYLGKIRQESAAFASAMQVLAKVTTSPNDWPRLPAPLIAHEVEQWWRKHRGRWSALIHDTYSWLARLVVRRRRLEEVIAEFEAQEKHAILQAAKRVLDELDRLVKLGNQVIQPRLAPVLSGDRCQQLLARLEQQYAQLQPVNHHDRAFLQEELQHFASKHPRAVKLLVVLDTAWASARPSISASLVFAGWIVGGPLGAIVGFGATGPVDQLSVRLGKPILEAILQFDRKLQTRHVQQRCEWLGQLLRRELLGNVFDELVRGAQVPESLPFRSAEQLVAELSRLAQLGP